MERFALQPDQVFSRRLQMYLAMVTAAILSVVVAAGASPLAAQPGGDNSPSAPLVIDDFESYSPGTFPDEWVFVKRDKSTIPYSEAREPGETVEVRSKDGNQYLAVETNNEALRYTQRNGKEFDWTLDRRPRIAWRWRAKTLPAGASERGENDTGGALYVTFGSDWLGRPKSIKYTYSSSLPVGTVVSFGPLKVIVVDSAREPRMGEWKTVMRDIPSDYRQVFGEDPPNRPLSITFWSDSDTTGDSAEVHFDDIRFLPPFQRDN